MPIKVYSQTNKAVKIGDKTSFLVTIEADTFQWQVNINDGNGFNNLQDTTLYKGIKTKKLSILNVTTSMKNYIYQCIAKVKTKNYKIININEGKYDTLKVKVAISNLNNRIILDGGEIAITADAASQNDFQWQCDSGTGFKDIDTNAKGKIYKINIACTINRYKYRCVVGKGTDTIISNVDTLMITGCITQYPNSIQANKNAFFTVSHDTALKLKYKWYVNPFNSGDEFMDISASDSDYGGNENDTLFLKNTYPAMHNSLYKVDVFFKDGNKILLSDTTRLIISGKIARIQNQNRLQLTGALYSGIQGFKDDNSASLTQIYLRGNIYLHKTQGFDINSNNWERLIMLRNIFFQGILSTNVDNIKYFNIKTDSFNRQDTAKYRGVNRLDLYKNANLNFNIMIPILTYVVPAYKPHYGDLAHIYIDPFFAMLRTTVSNSNLKDTTNSLNVYSSQYGINLGIRFEDLKLSKLPFYLEIQTKIFWINVLTNSVNPNLSYQQSKVMNDYTPNYSKGLLSQSNNPYYNADVLIIYNTSSSSTSNVFLHASYFTNIVSSSNSQVNNTFWQLQGGYALDINSLFSKLTKK